MNKKNKRLLSWILTVSFSLSLTMGFTPKKVSAEEMKTKDVHSILSQSKSKKFSSSDVQNKLKSKYGTEKYFNDNAPLKHTNPEDVVRVVVQLKDKPLLEKVKGEKQNNKSVKSLIDTKKNDLNALKKQQDKVITKAQKFQGAKIRNRYYYTANGFSMDVKRGEINKLKSLSGVHSVKEANKYKPDMTYAKGLTQVYDAWKDYGYKGQGTVVAVVDSGIDYTHKDMRLSDDTTPKIPENKALLADDKGKYYSSKVPYAYNFADKNNDILDTNPNTGMHGMHVAGIIAGNGSENETKNLQAIQGVAPEAQILSMRVFSNRPEEKYAYGDDIAAGIESSILHEADVINMSLGSDAGFQDPEDVEQKAIEHASENGIIVVVSAGNSAYSTYQSKYAGVVDTGVVGAPGISEAALQVASYENTNIIASALNITSSSGKDKMAYIATDTSPVGILTGEYSIVDCGLGQVEELDKKDLQGKIALVKRGGITFVEKQLNAQKAGAVGIVIYNKDGLEDYVKMASDVEVTIPGMFVKNSDGVKLKGLIEKDAKLSFKGETMAIDNANKDKMSDFTSWGPAPNLEFKPEIAAPGGQIYSTVNNNSYEVMSGTSMAAPHTSGAEALLVQAMKNKKMDLSGRDIIDFAKATSINTAVPKIDEKGVPFSPRRQGAGLIQIKDAINNKVTATDNNGNAAIALKEIDEKTTFELVLTNHGDADVTYKLSNNGKVLTEIKETEGMSYDVVIPNASLKFDAKGEVTVPKNSTKSVYATVNLSGNFDKDQFVEGFIKLESKTDGAPNLNVPFIGFYGDWSNLNIIDRPMWDSNTTIYGTTTLLSRSDNKLAYLGAKEDAEGNIIVDPNKIAISPDGDGYNDEAIPYLVFLRNAKEIEMSIVDGKGNTVKDISTDTYINKDIINEQDGKVGKYQNKWNWDGKIENKETGKSEVKEGQYSYVIKSKIDYDSAKWQEIQMPVKIDITAPKVNITSSNNAHSSKYMLKWTSKDENSGVDINGVFFNEELIKGLKINDLGNDEYCCEINLNEGDNKIEVVSLDNASNMGSKVITIKYSPFNLKFDNLEDEMKVNARQYTVTGQLNCAVKDLIINGANAVVNEDLSFSCIISLPDTENNVTVKAIDNDGTILKDYSIKVYCDTTPPTMNFSQPKVDGDGKVYTNQDKITVEGTVFDDTFGYKFYINGELKMEVNLPKIGGEQGTKRDFNYEVPVTNGCNVEVKSVDQFGNETPVKVFNVVVDKENPVITIAEVENGKAYNHDLLPLVTTNEGTLTMTLNNKSYNNEVITKEGSYELIANAVDKSGNSSEMKVNFTIDKTNPIMTIKGVEDGKCYNVDVKPIVTTNEGTITMTLNGNKYTGETIKDAGKYELVAIATDVAGNKSEAKVNFTIDKTNPEITIKGVEDGKCYNVDVKPTLTTNEGTITMTLNGNKYTGETIKDAGKYELVAIATDASGNKTEVKVNFTIDKTNPEITITGVEDGKTYETSVKPEIKTSEGKLTMTLDGKEYNGEEISAEGSHELAIKAVDLAGNTTNKVVKFKIEMPKAAEDQETKIVKTGAMVDMKVLIIIGASLIAAGAFFVVYRKKNKKTI